ncbi:MAG: hypothetical protein A3K23_06165 [Desulfobacca sp. RBG_16_58_9]|nr:MAG: hypothetical protein A3K23_06165 [Desulfobacca sp. RBG_16_58_9]
MNVDDTVVLRTFASRIEAEIVAGLLKGEGIETRLLSEFDAFMFPDLQHMSGVRLLVSAEDEAQAREILQAMEEESEPPDE